MRIGSFFLILLVALITLGFLLSDSMHLRAIISNQQKEVGRLNQAMQQVEQEKQVAVMSLQDTSQELQSCQQQVEQSNQIIVHLTNENTSLREQNRLLVTQGQLDTSNAISRPEVQPVQATAFGLITFITLGLGSIVMMGLKNLQKRALLKWRTDKTGSYVYLANTEIRELVQRRRKASRCNPPHSNS